MCRYYSAIALFLAIGIPGCGPKGPIMVPVTGTVTLDDKPMEEGTVYFKTIIEGSVDEMAIKDGKFQGMVQVGDRRVEVCKYGLGPPIKMGAAEIPNKIETLPVRYNLDSELKATVKEDGPNDFTFAVKSK
jgi:predicted small lipoprotein YifL